MAISRRNFLKLTGFSAVAATFGSFSVKAASTTHYIDPTVAATGDGTINNPWKSWHDVVWQDGDVYLQKAGTTWTGSHFAIGADGVALGKYGGNTLPILKGTSAGVPPAVGWVLTIGKKDCVIQDLRFEGGAGDNSRSAV